MSLLSIVITLIIAGILLWLVNTYIPMDGKIKKILNIVVVVVVVIWLLNVFGVWGHLSNVRAAIPSPVMGTTTSSLVSVPVPPVNSGCPVRT
jgi:xanthine/uracil permease